MFVGWLFSWWRRWRCKPLRHWQVVLYTRHGCHLCDLAWKQLEQSRHRHRFSLSRVDVDGDPRLAEQFGQQVPVVLINGKVRFRGRINAVLWRRLLDAEGNRDREGETP